MTLVYLTSLSFQSVIDGSCAVFKRQGLHYIAYFIMIDFTTQLPQDVRARPVAKELGGGGRGLAWPLEIPKTTFFFHHSARPPGPHCGLELAGLAMGLVRACEMWFVILWSICCLLLGMAEYVSTMTFQQAAELFGFSRSPQSLKPQIQYQVQGFLAAPINIDQSARSCE